MKKVDSVHIQKMVVDVGIVENLITMVPHLPGEFPNSACESCGPRFAGIPYSWRRPKLAA
jgi:hypothetical protein